MKYAIEEVYEIICDIDKIITVTFKVEGDGEGYYRELVDSDYYNWCYEHYVENSDLSEYEDEEEMIMDYFGYDKWNMFYSNEEMVSDYLYENYVDLKSLPLPKK